MRQQGLVPHVITDNALLSVREKGTEPGKAMEIASHAAAGVGSGGHHLQCSLQYLQEGHTARDGHGGHKPYGSRSERLMSSPTC